MFSVKTEDHKKPRQQKISAKRLFTVMVLMVITALVVAFGSWTFVNLGEDNITRTNEAHIGFLEKQLLQLSVAVKTQETLAKNNVPLGSIVSTVKQ